MDTIVVASVNTSARAFVIPADANGGGKSGHPRYRGQNPGLIRGRGKDRRRVPGYGNLHGHDSGGFPRRQVPRHPPDGPRLDLKTRPIIVILL